MEITMNNVLTDILTSDIPLEEDLSDVIEPAPCPGRPRKDGAPVISKIRNIKCELCGKEIRSGILHERHMLKCHPNSVKNLTCPNCDSKFLKKDDLVTHILSHWEVDKECPIIGENPCTFKYTRKAKMIAHLLKKHYDDMKENEMIPPVKVSSSSYNKKKTSHLCSFCDKSFERASQLIRHTRIHTGEKPYECNQCGLKFNQKNSLVIHVRIHNNERPYKCPKCPAAFIQKGGLKSHLKRVHPIKAMSNRLLCPHCSCIFRNMQALKIHFAKYHQVLTEDQMMLNTINNVMEGLACLNDQSQNNTDILQKALNCSGVSPVESTSIPNESDLAQQLKTMLSDDINNLLNPSIKLKKTRQLECTTCKKVFKKQSDLLRHMQTHLNVKLFKCNICDKSFRQSRELTFHQQRLHKINPIAQKNNEDRQISKKDVLLATHTTPISFSIRERNDSLRADQQSQFFIYDDNTINISIPENDNSTLNMIDNNDSVPNIGNIISLDNILHADGMPVLNESETAFPKGTEMIDPTFFQSDDSKQPLDNRIFISDIPNDCTKNDFQLILTGNNLFIDNNVMIEPTVVTNICPNDTLIINGLTYSESVPNQTVVEISTMEPIESNKPSQLSEQKRLEFLAHKESLKANKAYKNPPLANRCDECPASFAKPSDLVRHRRTHTREKPFTCDICNCSFSLARTLQVHKNVHIPSAEKKKCQVCGKFFATTNALNVHMRRHNGVKPFPCSLCPKKFRTVGHRTSHLAGHFKANNTNS